MGILQSVLTVAAVMVIISSTQKRDFRIRQQVLHYHEWGIHRISTRECAVQHLNRMITKQYQVGKND